jgi:heat shock protein HslJ
MQEARANCDDLKVREGRKDVTNMKNLLIALLLLALPVAACTTHQPDPLAGSEWLILSIEELKAGNEALLQFQSEGRVAGQTGVNSMRGTYTLANGVLRFGPLKLTRLAGPAELMHQEARLVNALEHVDGFERDGIHLKLTNDGKVVMALRQTDWD